MKDAALIISTGATAMLFAVAEAVTERAARNKEKRIFTVCNNESSNENIGRICSWEKIETCALAGIQ